MANAQGHPLVRVSLGREGGGRGGSTRKSGPPWSADRTPRTAARRATRRVLPTESGVVPPGSKPMIAPGNLGGGVLPPGFAHRERGVAEEQRNCGRRPGLAHPERGVAVQHGLESLKLDSHRLSGSGSSSWALGTRPSNSASQALVIISTLGIELCLLPAKGTGSLACSSGGSQSEPRVSHACSQQFVSGVLELLLPPLASEIVRLDV